MWNYRLIRDKNGILHIHEVFYTKKGKILGHTEPIELSGMKKKDIIGDLEYLFQDISQHKILDKSEIREHLAKPKWMKEKGKVEKVEYLELGGGIVNL